jgi:hypothetical protein
MLLFALEIGIYLCDNFLSIPQCYCNPKKLTDIYNLKNKEDLCSQDIFILKEMEVYQIIHMIMEEH